ncbi:hypothetical protein HJG60_009086 [Phyllostomus discolor]|uniref:Uncharacterized protein n=1 Tax=Phyllostomus discolor TaxID=89673 RepID=A0A833YM76_9CHIR|nr:hypothetical protein HJG60_009086 [Phyllostomus discolor]
MVICILSSKFRPKSTSSVSFLITSVLNCASDRLANSWSLKRMSPGGLICSVENIFFFPSLLFFFSGLVALVTVGSRALGAHWGWAPQSLDCDIICGGGAGAGAGREKTMAVVPFPWTQTLVWASVPRVLPWPTIATPLGLPAAACVLRDHRCLLAPPDGFCADFAPNLPPTSARRRPEPAPRLPGSSSPTRPDEHVYFNFLAARLPFR